jgi:hypothetical protein
LGIQGPGDPRRDKYGVPRIVTTYAADHYRLPTLEEGAEQMFSMGKSVNSLLRSRVGHVLVPRPAYVNPETGEVGNGADTGYDIEIAP